MIFLLFCFIYHTQINRPCWYVCVYTLAHESWNIHTAIYTIVVSLPSVLPIFRTERNYSLLLLNTHVYWNMAFTHSITRKPGVRSLSCTHMYSIRRTYKIYTCSFVYVYTYVYVYIYIYNRRGSHIRHAHSFSSTHTAHNETTREIICCDVILGLCMHCLAKAHSVINWYYSDESALLKNYKHTHREGKKSV